MSRLYRNCIEIDSSVDLSIDGSNCVSISNAKYTWVRNVHSLVELNLRLSEGKKLLKVSPFNDSKEARKHAGTTYSIIKSAVAGLVNPFVRRLIFEGPGYKCSVEGQVVSFKLNFSHPLEYTLPSAMDGKNESPTILALSCFDKEMLGKACSEIKALKWPDAYKGQGIRYENETIVTKTPKKKAK